VQPAARPVASGVSSADPVLLIASHLNVPDDLLYYPADGSVLVGDHGDGHLVRISPGGITVLPQVVPEAEGIADINGVTYVADQYDARVVALTATGGVRTVIQLQPVPSGENLDGISSDFAGTGLVVPDSPHGVVLFVDTGGRITGRVGGFSRPAGASVDLGGGYLIADENASAVFEIKNGRATRIASNLPGADDAARTAAGHLLAILPGQGRLVDVTAGRNLATGLRNVQGLGFDGAGNVLLTESDAGRVDLLVTSFAITVPAGVVQLTPGQGVCFGVIRAPGNADSLRVYEAVGALPLTDPGAGASGEVVPGRCSLAACVVTIQVLGPSGTEFAQFSYRD
jgi:hypothetical protein